MNGPAKEDVMLIWDLLCARICLANGISRERLQEMLDSKEVSIEFSFTIDARIPADG